MTKQAFMNARDNDAADEFFYLYCITGTMPLYPPEEPARDIEVVRGNGLYAVVGRVSSVDFSEENMKRNLSDPKWVEAKVLLHHKIIGETMAKYTVVPFKFATIFRTKENIKALLDKHNAAFKNAIELLEGGEEWGVKVFCNPERLKTVLEEEAGEIRKIEGEMSLSSAGKNYFLKKKKDRMTEEMVGKKIHEYGQNCYETLAKQSREAGVNEPLPKQASGRNDDMILNAAFLVDKTKCKGFFDSIDYLKERYHPKGLYLACTGPWPPYNFCSIIGDLSHEHSRS